MIATGRRAPSVSNARSAAASASRPSERPHPPQNRSVPSRTEPQAPARASAAPQDAQNLRPSRFSVWQREQRIGDRSQFGARRDENPNTSSGATVFPCQLLRAAGLPARLSQRPSRRKRGQESPELH